MEDFNLPSPERIVLLERLDAAIGGVPPHFWAACQICNLKALERLVEYGSEFPDILRTFTHQTRTMADYWAPSPSQRLKPIQQIRDLAEQRDKFCCFLTGSPFVDVVDIYPHHSLKRKEEDKAGQRHIFWNTLKNFWSEEKVASWEAELFPAGICEFGIEGVYNLITLSARNLWAEGAFALKPISMSDDKMTLKVQFFWQQKQKDIQPTMSLLTTPSSTEGLDAAYSSTGEVLSWLVNKNQRPSDYGRSLRLIKSGDYFALQTEDPETKPLPSFQLLELQWFLQRIRGMAGAALIDWPPFSDSGSNYSDKEEGEAVEE